MVLPEADLKELLPSGIQTKFENRVAWAKSYFTQAKVLESPRRSMFRITQRGSDLHKAGHKRIDIRILNQYPEFLEFHKAKSPKEEEQEPSKETPEETLRKSYENIRGDLASQIVHRIAGNSPQFFESTGVDLMVAMGYGGGHALMQENPLAVVGMKALTELSRKNVFDWIWST